ncbi:MAG: AI-2E family transporter, partial [Prolixibacteraceae bacterium]
MAPDSENFGTGKKFKIVLSVFLVTGSLYFIFVGLTSGMDFFVPLVTAIILAMVMNPVASRLRKWGVSKVIAVLLSDLIIIAFIGFMVFLMAAQANRVAENWSQIEKRMEPKIEKVQNFFNRKLNMQPLDDLQKNMLQSQPEQTSAKNQEPQQNQQAQQSGTQQEDSSSFSLSNIRSKLTGI